LATSPTITVAGVALGVDPTSAAPREPVTVTLAGGPGNAGDWVGWYVAETLVDWRYLNGTQLRPPAGLLRHECRRERC